MRHGLGHEPARLKIQRRRNRRLRQGAVEDPERRVQRDEKSRLRTRTQFWPRQKIPGDDPGRAKPARLRLAFCPRSHRTALEGRTRGGCEANRLFRRPPDPDELCRLSLLAGLLRIHHHLHHSTGTAQKSENRMILGKKPTFRIAGTLSQGKRPPPPRAASLLRIMQVALMLGPSTSIQLCGLSATTTPKALTGSLRSGPVSN